MLGESKDSKQAHSEESELERHQVKESKRQPKKESE